MIGIRTKVFALFTALALALGVAAPASAAYDPEVKKGLELIRQKRFDQAQRVLEAKAMKGDKDAAYFMGMMYLNSQGARKDPATMVKWFSMAAERGHPDAQYQMGDACLLGLSVPKDMNRALYWYDLAAKQRHAKAIGKLGYLYYSGDGVPRDAAKGAKLLRMAADRGDVASLASWGVILKNGGPGIKPDPAKAAVYLQQAGRHGSVVAMFHLAQLYYTGSGVPLDKKTALQLLQQAAVRGYPPAQQALSNMNEKGIIRIFNRK